MRTFQLAAVAAIAATSATASPLLNFNFDSSSVASSPFYQATSKLAAWLTQSHHHNQAAASPALTEEQGDKTLWQIINKDPHFTQLAHILNYSSDATKELLDGGEKGLTLLAPVNWRREDHKDAELKDAPITSHAAFAHWADLESQVTSFEAFCGGDDKDDDKEKERRRRFIRMLIDATLRYHLVLSKHGALSSEEIAKNSSVATHLHVPESAAKYVGYLLDGEPFRVRTGKSLLPRPSVYFNFYSRLVYPDVRASGDSLLHAISAPLFVPPSALQDLLYGSNEFSTTTTALYKLHSQGYLSLPIHHRPEKKAHAHHEHDDDDHKPPHRPDGPHDGPHHGPPGQDGPRGNAAFTFFAPSNLAWFKLPPMFKAYLLSPWGERLLAKILMLHAVPSDVLYADAVWHVSDKQDKKAGSSSVLDATHEVNVLTTYGSTNVSTYVVNSALPKLNHTHELHGEAKEYEQLTVKVYRYFLLPGGHGPLQTRMDVQGVPVSIQDIPAANGVVHLLNAFIKPADHDEHRGVWNEVESEARRLGFASETERIEL